MVRPICGSKQSFRSTFGPTLLKPTIAGFIRRSRTTSPMIKFAHQLLTSSGSNFRTPQVNFYRALQSKEPKAIAQVVALTFLCERTDTLDRPSGLRG